jgi:hypothetical protein
MFKSCRIYVITVMIEAVRTSKTSVYSNETTRRYIPERSKLHIVFVEFFYNVPRTT